jgi:hypothetical protein
VKFNMGVFINFKFHYSYIFSELNKLQGTSFIIFVCYITEYRPPLWSNGQSFWLLTQGSRVRFAALPDFSEQQ